MGHPWLCQGHTKVPRDVEVLHVQWREASALHVFLGALLQFPQIPVAGKGLQLAGACGNTAVAAFILCLEGWNN